MHLDGLALSGEVGGGEVEDHTGLEDSGLDSSDGDGTDSGDLEDIVEGESERKVSWPLGGLELDEGVSLVPLEVVGLLDEVLSGESRDRHEGDGGGLVSGGLEETLGLLHDLVESLLRVVGGGVVHLVDGDDHLL